MTNDDSSGSKAEDGRKVAGRKTFRLAYTMTCDLAVKELWPNGDGPENPSVEDVEELIEDCGGWRRVIGDWNLDESGDGHVFEVQS
jgi:hypothetical protein